MCEACKELDAKIEHYEAPTGVERHVSAAYSDLRICPLPPHFLQRPG
jgi:hypothetical protein